ncbi:hypothetical protein ACFXKG_14530 [Streptomyces sp. NPDC059255]|uniref:hypothetical protein n=1 Tax=Streptomyces sp. NPDC059255 TaxID=3346793 RepID=UPI0036B862CA
MTTRLYHVTVTGEGPIPGTWVRVLLAARQTGSPDRALSILRCQARRIADGLDPDPRSAWAAPGVLARQETAVHDAPAELRAWCDDFEAQEAARNQLIEGAEFTFGAMDHSGRYTLKVLPVRVPSLAPPPAVPRAPRRRHRKPRWFDRFRRPAARTSAPGHPVSTPSRNGSIAARQASGWS